MKDLLLGRTKDRSLAGLLQARKFMGSPRERQDKGKNLSCDSEGFPTGQQTTPTNYRQRNQREIPIAPGSPKTVLFPVHGQFAGLRGGPLAGSGIIQMSAQPGRNLMSDTIALLLAESMWQRIGALLFAFCGMAILFVAMLPSAESFVARIFPWRLKVLVGSFLQALSFAMILFGILGFFAPNGVTAICSTQFRSLVL